MTIAVPLANQMLIAASSYALFTSLHGGDPGATGAGELAGVARRPSGWVPPTSGTLLPAGPLHFGIPASTSVGGFGFWTSTVAGVFAGGNSLTAIESFAAPGTYSINSLSLPVTLTG